MSAPPTLAASVNVSVGTVALSLVLVAIAIGASVVQRADLEKDLGIAVLRSFVQLTAIGYVITLLFNANSLALTFALLAVMVVVGALTARSRATAIPGAFASLLIAIGLATVATVGIVVALGIFAPEPRYLIPIAGMVIGNSMTAAAVALNRLGDEVTRSRDQIEATLALGATSAQAARPLLRRSLRSGLIPLIDQTKTTGIVTFPGIMVGMLLAGAEPLDAVRLQLVILYSLLGAVAIAALLATSLSYRRFFTQAHQLKEMPGD